MCTHQRPESRLAAGASFGLHIVFVDSAKYVSPPSGPVGTPCVMLRSAVNYEDNFESCVCVLHITSFQLWEFLPCKPICFILYPPSLIRASPVSILSFRLPPSPRSALSAFTLLRQTDSYLPNRLERNPSIVSRNSFRRSYCALRSTSSTSLRSKTILHPSSFFASLATSGDMVACIIRFQSLERLFVLDIDFMSAFVHCANENWAGFWKTNSEYERQIEGPIVYLCLINKKGVDVSEAISNVKAIFLNSLSCAL